MAYIKILLQEAYAPLAKGLPSVVEVLKKQLTLSESTVKDLREQIHTLQNTVEQLTLENNELKQKIHVRHSIYDHQCIYYQLKSNTYKF